MDRDSDRRAIVMMKSDGSKSSIDSATTCFYDRYAQTLAERPEAQRSALSARFAKTFCKGERVLDIGAGSGRDMAVLFEQGCDVHGVEPNASMRAFALHAHPQLRDRIVPGALPDLGDPFGGAFDGIVCSAMLMHVAASDIDASFEAMSRLLVTGGRLLISVPQADETQLHDACDLDGRLFTNHAVRSLSEQSKRCRLHVVDQWRSDVALAESGIRWHEQLLIKQPWIEQP